MQFYHDLIDELLKNGYIYFKAYIYTNDLTNKKDLYIIFSKTFIFIVIRYCSIRYCFPLGHSTRFRRRIWRLFKRKNCVSVYVYKFTLKKVIYSIYNYFCNNAVRISGSMQSLFSKNTVEKWRIGSHSMSHGSSLTLVMT